MLKSLFLVVVLLFLSGCVTGNAIYSEDAYEVIPVSEITTQMQKYSYFQNGVEIRYFTVLDYNGNIKVAFDACEVCGGRLGYTQQGNNVVCENCGLNFEISNLGTANKGGGCWPSYLGFKVENGNVMVSQEDLAAGAYHFT